MKESEVVKKIKECLEKELKNYIIKDKSNLFYELYLNKDLKLNVNTKKPKRGYSAFQTDLCIYRKLDNNIELPIVAIEFKRSLSTHDIITYSEKALRHKKIYPQLRYGMLSYDIEKISGKFFTHNIGIDFYYVIKKVGEKEKENIVKILNKEIIISKNLEEINLGTNYSCNFYRNYPQWENI